MQSHTNTTKKIIDTTINPLQDWQAGKQVNFGTEAKPYWLMISSDALIKNFYAVLAGHCEKSIKSMWDGNSRLQNTIKHLQDTDKVTFRRTLEKVLASHQSAKNNFIREYLDWINDAEVLRIVLTSIVSKYNGKKNYSHYLSSRISLLERRLAVLHDEQAASSKEMSAASDEEIQDFLQANPQWGDVNQNAVAHTELGKRKNVGTVFNQHHNFFENGSAQNKKAKQNNPEPGNYEDMLEFLESNPNWDPRNENKDSRPSL